jgi:hypothetical protein
LAAALVYAPTLLDAAAGPDAALQSILQNAEGLGLSIEIPGSSVPLRSRRLHFDRISTHLEPTDQAALARSTLDFEGTLGSIEVSSLGVETTAFDRQGGGWRPRNGLAPRLAAAVAALEARRRALERGDGDALGALAASAEVGRAARESDLLRRAASGGPFHPIAWYIRLERDRALVTECYQIDAGGGDSSAPKSGKRRLTLELRGSQFLFSGSLL